MDLFIQVSVITMNEDIFLMILKSVLKSENIIMVLLTFIARKDNLFSPN